MFALRCTFAFLLSAASLSALGQSAPVQGYWVVHTYPHSTASYTEGFFYLDDLFYEGTGLTGHSQLLVITPATGKPVKQLDLAPELFGEGIVDWGPNLYEWTWKSHICFVYDRATLHKIKQLSYDGEGWGMTHDEHNIITSDGSARLSLRDPETFKVVRQIAVMDGAEPVNQLNELEYIHGEIYANVWHSDRIARISPKTGRVIAWIDLAGILPASKRVDAESVINGIAYDAKRNRIFVTGKQWPAIFEIIVLPRNK